ncbi:hypothetical protein YYC_01478 [Plasmodium yoelii 17X]|uniref:Uncharacterized protein n=2 Tax=Plasmodium yoelii TaxID=5861 RepID=Q7R921_PLAYO|nr:hypothetical protein [Plasmodium yoelii yoelii]ETB61623.1 hypothetical protein YYC_01478 [Plasmodium yoelii 17X]
MYNLVKNKSVYAHIQCNICSFTHFDKLACSKKFMLRIHAYAIPKYFFKKNTLCIYTNVH